MLYNVIYSFEMYGILCPMCPVNASLSAIAHPSIRKLPNFRCRARRKQQPRGLRVQLAAQSQEADDVVSRWPVILLFRSKKGLEDDTAENERSTGGYSKTRPHKLPLAGKGGGKVHWRKVQRLHNRASMATQTLQTAQNAKNVGDIDFLEV